MNSTGAEISWADGLLPLSALQPIATDYVDSSWAETNREVVIIPRGTLLWHKGTTDAQALSDCQSLCATRIDPEQNDGLAQSLAAGTVVSGAVHLFEFSTKRDLKMAECGRPSLLRLERFLFQRGSHRLTEALFAWIAQKGLDGIVAVDGAGYEVVVGRPQSDLMMISSMPKIR